MIYIILSLFTISIAYLVRKGRNDCITEYKNGIIFTNRENIRALFLLLILEAPMIIVSGLRYGISIDYLPVYEKSFYQVITGIKPEYETGFYYFNKLCIAICKEPWFMFLSVSAITIIVFVKSFWKYSSNFFLSIVLFFAMGTYFDTFNGIRQYVAVALFVWSVQYIESREWIKYIISIMIGSLFHTSILFLLPVYFLVYLHIGLKTWAIIVSIIYGIRFYLFDITKFIMTHNPRYVIYITRNSLSRNTSFTSSGLISTLVALIPFLIIFIENKKPYIEDVGVNMSNKRRIGTFFFNMNMIGICVAIISGILPLADRILYYFKGVFLLSIPFATEQLYLSGRSKTISYVVVGLLAGMTILGIVLFDWYAIIPYRSILNN